MARSETLTGLCDAVLDYAVLALDSIPDDDPTLVGAPTRRFVAPGLPAVECCQTSRGGDVPGQLSVHVQTMQEESTAPTSPALAPTYRPRVTGRVVSVSLVVMIARCVPVGNATRPPKADDWAASAAQIQADGWALWNGLWRAQRDDAAFATWCDGMFVDQAANLPPQGGCGGWVFVVRPIVQGYNPFST